LLNWNKSLNLNQVQNEIIDYEYPSLISNLNIILCIFLTLPNIYILSPTLILDYQSHFIQRIRGISFFIDNPDDFIGGF